ncbi:MAG: glycosyltransferase [Gemmatimonadales bacterium]|nr:glycosyltransferase [Gemmatimonadales bacterium]
MTRILVLAPFPPRLDGTHGGARSIAELVSRLAERHEVALAYLRATEEQDVDPVLRERCTIVRAVIRPPRSRLARLPALVRGVPLWVGARAVPAFATCVRELERAFRPDMVQAEFHAMGQYFDALEGRSAQRILVEHEPGAAAARDAIARAPATEQFGARLDAHAWRRYERAVLQAADAVVVLTERDLHAVTPMAGTTRVVRIPLGATVPARPLDPVGTAPGMVFVGNFRHPPNLDAAERLVTVIHPIVRSHRTDVTLTLVGDAAPDTLVTRAARAGASVVLAGRVPSVTPFLDAAAVVAVPLRHGGGMRVKVLEALAAGKAVVASALAVEGLEVVNGREFLLAGSDEEFASATLRLLGDIALRRSLALRARAWTAATCGWDRTVESYEALYRSLDRSGTAR